MERVLVLPPYTLHETILNIMRKFLQSPTVQAKGCKAVGYLAQDSKQDLSKSNTITQTKNVKANINKPKVQI